MNMTAIHVVVEELLRNAVDKSQLKDHHDFMNVQYLKT